MALRGLHLQSSAFDRAGYDAQTRELVVHYKGGGAYTYHDVSPELVAQMEVSDSAGRFLAAHVKNAHRVTKHGR